MDINEFDFFNDLSSEDKDFLKNNIKAIQIPKDMVLFYEGDICKDIMLLKSGEIRALYSKCIECHQWYSCDWHCTKCY